MPREMPRRNRPECHICQGKDFRIDHAGEQSTMDDWYACVRCIACGEIAQDERLLKILLGED